MDLYRNYNITNSNSCNYIHTGVDLLSRKTEKDLGKNMKNMNTEKLDMFPSFGNLGVGIYLII